MNKEKFAVDEKTYENQDGMIIKIIFFFMSSDKDIISQQLKR